MIAIGHVTPKFRGCCPSGSGRWFYPCIRDGPQAYFWPAVNKKPGIFWPDPMRLFLIWGGNNWKVWYFWEDIFQTHHYPTCFDHTRKPDCLLELRCLSLKVNMAFFQCSNSFKTWPSSKLWEEIEVTDIQTLINILSTSLKVNYTNYFTCVIKLIRSTNFGIFIFFNYRIKHYMLYDIYIYSI